LASTTPELVKRSKLWPVDETANQLGVRKATL
jgi:hypothetical protein